jgi:hypothetical protein
MFRRTKVGASAIQAPPVQQAMNSQGKCLATISPTRRGEVHFGCGIDNNCGAFALVTAGIRMHYVIGVTLSEAHTQARAREDGRVLVELAIGDADITGSGK